MRPLLLLPLLLLAAQPASGAEVYYRSNDFGMKLQRIEPYERGGSEWILGVQVTDAGETRRLYDNGKEARRWEVSWTEGGTMKVERELASGVLVNRKVYDTSGNLLQEEQYAGGDLSQKSLLTYIGGRLSRMRVLAPDGSVLYTEEYHYATSGALREVRRTSAGGDTQLSAVVLGPAGISEERSTTGATLLITRYDTEGRVVNRELRDGDEIVSREDFLFRADSDFLLASTEKLPAEGKTVDRRYDEAGRLVSETTTANGAVVELMLYTRDDQGNVTARSRRTAGGVETWKYSLGQDGKVVREEYYRRGSLEKVTTYGEGKLRTEELYQDGALFLKVYYDGDTRLREEVYEGGKLLRERKYP